MLGLGAVGIAVGASAQSAVTRVLGPVNSQVGGLIPAAGGFRYYSVVDSVKRRTPETYKLNVTGMVTSPRSFTFAELQAMPQTQITKDFQCVTGWRVPGVQWSGVALPDLLDAVGVDPKATAVRFHSFDGAYTESLTMVQARRRDILVATTMLGAPVTHDHGGPVRLFAAPMYGYKSLKWLGGIELVNKVVPGFWEVRGYDVDAWVGRSNGRDDAPT
ncbi:MAG: oxidoreductase molybdopterin binding [Actinomycetia bacterium]|nr:oxidoreductase molybdopterin binding [Actinomycetes bacterium]